MCPNIIHYTGDIQVPNASITNPANFTLSCETKTTSFNGNDFIYEDEVVFSQHKPSKVSDNVTYSDITIKAKELSRTVKNDRLCARQYSHLYLVGLVCFIMVHNLI